MSYEYFLSMDDGARLPWATSKVVCVGQNYADHIKEMNASAVPDPVIFMKPATALKPLSAPIKLPSFSENVHYELELAVIIGDVVQDVVEAEVDPLIHAYALAIDLTARDLQFAFKDRGHPWDLAKGFDDSCPISQCIPAHRLENPQDVALSLMVNGEQRQQSSTAMMIHKIAPLISFMSRYVTLLPGDVVLTGTPAGVGQLQSGDQLACKLGDVIAVQTQVL